MYQAPMLPSEKQDKEITVRAARFQKKMNVQAIPTPSLSAYRSAGGDVLWVLDTCCHASVDRHRFQMLML